VLNTVLAPGIIWMNTQFRLALIALVGAVAVAVLTFPLWIPFFVNREVDEGFPGLSPAEQQAFSALPNDQQDALMEMTDEDPLAALAFARAAITGPQVVAPDQQPMPDTADQPLVLSTGDFIRIDALHSGSGTASIYQLPDDTRFLRFEGFSVTNGPELHVLLSRHPDPRTREEVGSDYIDLGFLKGNIGDQNYDLPAGVDLSQYNSVVIYCLPFHVVFSTATL
jgi:hypothetical protein